MMKRDQMASSCEQKRPSLLILPGDALKEETMSLMDILALEILCAKKDTLHKDNKDKRSK